MWGLPLFLYLSPPCMARAWIKEEYPALVLGEVVHTRAGRVLTSSLQGFPFFNFSFPRPCGVLGRDSCSLDWLLTTSLFTSKEYSSYPSGQEETVCGDFPYFYTCLLLVWPVPGSRRSTQHLCWGKWFIPVQDES